MGRIEKLDPHVADLIAAGEVVERPASVVKELMENAIDAGATGLTVEIQNGGMSLIRVTDNGGGINPEDIQTAFLRHATSKLHSAHDLEAIGSLGFRGEALAAIAAVSRVEALSRVAGEDFGTVLYLEGGAFREQQQAGCPLGTTMLVRDLFFNTPARQKYMKRDVAEGTAVFALVQRLALSRPDISIKFFRDGKQELLTPGDGKALSVLHSVLGRDLALGFTEVKGQSEDISVGGFVTLPVCCRGSRNLQHFILNGRSIRSRLLTAALEEAYRNQKMVGKFPGCVLYVTAKLSAVDVNVHPAKMEVKFLNEKRVFDAVYHSVLTALGGEVKRPELRLPEVAKPAPAASTGGFQSMSAGQFRDSMAVLTGAPVRAESLRPVRVEGPEEPESLQTHLMSQIEIPMRHESPSLPAEAKLPEEQQKAAQESSITETKQPEQAQPMGEQIAETKDLPWRMAGEVLGTYIVVEQGDEIRFIDKHAAHERMNFDRLRSEEYVPMAQNLLEPLVIAPSPEETEILLAQLPLLEQFGFLLEDFGGGTLLLRTIPFDITREEAASLLTELAADLLAGKRRDIAAARDHLLSSIACKAAIKGGQKNAPEELLAVAGAVMSGQVHYCPHGRPVSITLRRGQLERQFGRA